MEEKVGRNDPCPCGSGKKYKKCCMAKEQKKRSFTAKVLNPTAATTNVKNALFTMLSKEKEEEKGEEQQQEPPPTDTPEENPPNDDSSLS